MRARTVAALLAVVVAACGRSPAPPSVDASEVEASESVSSAPDPEPDPDEARLAELRASDQFDEFAEHERAAKADGARLAWENFAPIVDGKRVEWTNKAELWDSIAPKIRDEALLLGPEYRKTLWNQRNAIPNAVAMAWSDKSTGGRGQYAEFRATYANPGAAERYWAFLIRTDSAGRGHIVSRMPPLGMAEEDYPTFEAQRTVLEERTWAWVQSQDVLPSD